MTGSSLHDISLARFKSLFPDSPRVSYGDDFYVMDMGKSNNGTAILYNPARIGRGIFFDARNVGKGEIIVNYNIPTTATEIQDFVNVVKEVDRQFGKASFHCEEENKEYTTAIAAPSVAVNIPPVIPPIIITINDKLGIASKSTFIT